MNQIDHQETLELIIQQWKDSGNLIGIVQASLSQANDIETALFEIRDLMYLNTAEGEALDFIGKVFTIDRLGRSDTDYRQAIAIRAVSRISGNTEEILEQLRLIFEATSTEYVPVYPAKYYLITDATISLAELQKLSVAGVLGVIIFENPGGGYIIDHEDPGDFIVDAGSLPIIDHGSPGSLVVAGSGLPLSLGITGLKSTMEEALK